MQQSQNFLSPGGLAHHGPIAGIAARGGHIATAGYDNQVILWEAASGKALARSLHDHLVNSCEFSPDGSLLVSASSDYSARIWEVPSMRLKVALTGHADDVDMAAFSPDGRRVATCALDRTLRIFDLEGRCLGVLSGHTGNIISLAWRGDGGRIVSSSVDGTVREWDPETGAALACHDLGGVRTDTVQIDSGGRIIAGDDRGRIVLIENGGMRFHDAHRAGIKKLVFDAHSGILATLSYDRTMAIWELRGPQPEEKARTTLPAPVWARAAALCGESRIAVGTFGSRYGSYDWKLDAWCLGDVVADRSLNAVAVDGDEVYAIGDAGMLFRNGMPRRSIGSLCNFLLPFGPMLLTGGQLGGLYDAGSGRLLHAHHSPLNCAAAFERSGAMHAAVGTYTGEVLVFAHDADRLVLVDVLKPYENAVKGIAFSNGKLFSVCASTQVAWHDAGDFRLIRTVRHAHDRIANACCPAGDGFASVGRDRVLRLWTSDADEAYPTPHPNSVKCIASSPDRETLLTGAYTGTLAGFDMATRSWHPLTRVTASGISSIAYDRRSGGFIASAYDGRLYPARMTS